MACKVCVNYIFVKILKSVDLIVQDEGKEQISFKIKRSNDDAFINAVNEKCPCCEDIKDGV